MRRTNLHKIKRTSFEYFLKTSSLKSLNYLHTENRRPVPTFIWLWVNLLLIVSTIILVNTLWEQLTINPTVTSLESTNFPLREVPFPAIGICNLNKISKRKLENVASFISETTGHEFEVIYRYMKILGTFYDYDDTYSHKFLEFQKILERYSHIENFSLNKIIKSIAPTCEDLLVGCSWKNELINCSDIFQLRLSFEGYCCIFNYVKETTEIISDTFLNKEKIFGYSGINYGLNIEINNDINDYFYTEHASLGANIHIFDSEDYPDKNSGSLTEHLIGFSKEFFMEIDTIGFRSVPEVINYPIEKRQCYFKTERETVFGPYSESDCLVDCRMKSMVAMCGCVPFMIPQDRSPVCGFSDMHCLNKYRSKWQSLVPPNAFQETTLLKEAHYSLKCDDRCYPLCDGFLYEIATTIVPTSDLSLGNNSILHIYYGDRYATIYKQDLEFYWFEIISKVGSLFGFMIGASLISLIELIVFCAYKLHKHFYEETRFDDNFCDCCIWTI